MKLMETDKTPTLLAQLRQRLHHPAQLRIAVTVLLLLAGYLGIYLPLGGQIADTTRLLRQQQQRRNLVRDIEHLREQCRRFQPRLSARPDANEWAQYVVGGTRRFHLKLIALKSEPPRAVGPYKAVALRLQLEGGFADLDRFLRWLETNERLFRVDDLTIAPPANGTGQLGMQLTVLGMMG